MSKDCVVFRLGWRIESQLDRLKWDDLICWKVEDFRRSSREVPDMSGLWLDLREVRRGQD